jgi:hypothetical protein
LRIGLKRRFIARADARGIAELDVQRRERTYYLRRLTSEERRQLEQLIAVSDRATVAAFWDELRDRVDYERRNDARQHHA